MARIVISGKSFRVYFQEDKYGTGCVILEHLGQAEIRETYEHESAEDAENTYTAIVNTLQAVSRAIGK